MRSARLSFFNSSGVSGLKRTLSPSGCLPITTKEPRSTRYASLLGEDGWARASVVTTASARSRNRTMSAPYPHGPPVNHLA